MIGIISIVNKLINSGHQRTVKAKKNIVVSLLIKGLNILIGFIQFPIALEYVGSSRYGIWLIIGSLIGWIGFFDIGLGNGLRNKFAEALAKGDKKSARVYVSTTYAILSLIMLAVMAIFFVVSRYIDWYKVFNASTDINENLSTLVYVVFGSFALQFVLKMITTILVADQKPALRDVIMLSGKIINLAVLLVLVNTTTGSLLNLGILYSITPTLALIFASIYFYSKDYKQYIPSIKFIDFKYARDLMNLGMKFFVLQIAVLVLYSTDNMIITQLYDPSQVTVYNIAFKYFSVVTMGSQIILAPFWSAATEAYFKNELLWIKKINRKLLLIWGITILVVIVMVLSSNFVYKIWIGDSVTVPMKLSISFGIYVVVYLYSSIFTTFINSTGKLKISIYSAVFNVISNIPLSIIFATSFNLGISGVILATALSNLITGIIRTIQFEKIVNNTAKGIWAK